MESLNPEQNYAYLPTPEATMEDGRYEQNLNHFESRPTHTLDSHDPPNHMISSLDLM